MPLRIITILCAVAIAGVAAFFSVIGLMRIFPGNVVGIMTMAIVLEVGKIAAAVWVHQKWDIITGWLKTYLLGAVVVLMGITSMGIYGYLSDAHLEHQEESANIDIDTSFVEESMARKRTTVDSMRTTLDALEEAFNAQVADNHIVLAFRQRQETSEERKSLQEGIATLQGEIAEERGILAATQRERASAERKIGPLRYLVDLLGGDGGRDSTAAQYLILAIVCVFDPLAICLMLAALPPRKLPIPPLLISEAPIVVDEVDSGYDPVKIPVGKESDPEEPAIEEQIAELVGGKDRILREGPDSEFYDLDVKPQKANI